MSVKVGEVIAVKGVKVTFRVDDETSKETLFYRGEKYRGVSIREYISVQRGFRRIVCLIEGEFLDERKIDGNEEPHSFLRTVEARPVGYFEDDLFRHGVKFMPMIRDPAFLMSEAEVSRVFGRAAENSLVIGSLLKEGIRIGLPWSRLFNTHIGIFGNTGSGKSNTLTKLLTTLFRRKVGAIEATSKFVLLDFNGEYTGDQITGQESKSIYRLSTSGGGGDKIPLPPGEFWNVETLSVLFQATTHTQRPFISRLVDGFNKYGQQPTSLTNYVRATVRASLCAASPKAESLDLLRNIARFLDLADLEAILSDVAWNSTFKVFYRKDHYENSYFNADGAHYDAVIAPVVDEAVLPKLSAFDELFVRAKVQLARELSLGFVQFDHINPLLKRLETALGALKKVVDVVEVNHTPRPLTVISLRRCGNDIKKILPLLICRHFYEAHKQDVATPPDSTLHLVIDEAHNILNIQSNREQESWKDYRLEQFEEIIKEGRKFGVFVTISSQRPADISPTIVSQLHNYFIHRLVNDRDLFLIENTVSSLDSVSRNLIPSLPQGCCVITGTSFDLPMVVQVDPLEKAARPYSDDVNLDELWADQ